MPVGSRGATSAPALPPILPGAVQPTAPALSSLGSGSAPVLGQARPPRRQQAAAKLPALGASVVETPSPSAGSKAPKAPTAKDLDEASRQRWREKRLHAQQRELHKQQAILGNQNARLEAMEEQLAMMRHVKIIEKAAAKQEEVNKAETLRKQLDTIQRGSALVQTLDARQRSSAHGQQLKSNKRAVPSRRARKSRRGGRPDSRLQTPNGELRLMVPQCQIRPPKLDDVAVGGACSPSIATPVRVSPSTATSPPLAHARVSPVAALGAAKAQKPEVVKLSAVQPAAPASPVFHRARLGCMAIPGNARPRLAEHMPSVPEKVSPDVDEFKEAMPWARRSAPACADEDLEMENVADGWRRAMGSPYQRRRDAAHEREMDWRRKKEKEERQQRWFKETKLLEQQRESERVAKRRQLQIEKDKLHSRVHEGGDAITPLERYLAGPAVTIPQSVTSPAEAAHAKLAEDGVAVSSQLTSSTVPPPCVALESESGLAVGIYTRAFKAARPARLRLNRATRVLAAEGTLHQAKLLLLGLSEASAPALGAKACELLWGHSGAPLEAVTNSDLLAAFVPSTGCADDAVAVRFCSVAAREAVLQALAEFQGVAEADLDREATVADDISPRDATTSVADLLRAATAIDAETQALEAKGAASPSMAALAPEAPGAVVDALAAIAPVTWPEKWEQEASGITQLTRSSLGMGRSTSKKFLDGILGGVTNVALEAISYEEDVQLLERVIGTPDAATTTGFFGKVQLEEAPAALVDRVKASAETAMTWTDTDTQSMPSLPEGTWM